MADAAATAAAPAAPPPPPTTADDGLPPVPAGYTALREGRAVILQRGNEVFYNPVQVVNRDLSIAVLARFAALRAREAAARGRGGGRRAHAAAAASARAAAAAGGAPGGLRVLEGLAASGLRAIRYALELDCVHTVVANDLDPAVAAALARNVAHNGGAAAAKVRPSTGDAAAVMLAAAAPGGAPFDAVDLDPYGSPSRLLDAAVQAVGEGGLLLVTATDMATLCGNHGEAAWAKYGAYPLHRPYCHEQALRIVLGALAAAAARHRRYIAPLISLSIDFYVRVFVRVYESPAEVKLAATKMAYLWQSQGCDSFFLQRAGRAAAKGGGAGPVKFSPGAGPAVPERCPDTGAGWTMGGPMWAEPLHDFEFLGDVLRHVRASGKGVFPAADRVAALLAAAAEELPDAPLYFQLHDVCRTLRTTPPRAGVLRSALVNAGFRVSGTHCCPLGTKTDAPWSAVWDVMRCWVAQQGGKPPPPDSAAARILAIPPTLQADFSRAPGAAPAGGGAPGKKRPPRFLPNPERNWGPKTMHGKKVRPQNEGQGKRRRQEPQQGAEGAAAAAEPPAAAPEGVAEQLQQQQQEQAVAMEEPPAAAEAPAAGGDPPAAA